MVVEAVSLASTAVLYHNSYQSVAEGVGYIRPVDHSPT